MEILEAIYTRRSIRKFTSEMVSKESIERLINAGIQAPSAMNQQPWAFSIIQNKELLQQISDRAKVYLLNRIDEKPILEKYREAFMNTQYNIFYHASTLITVYAKPGPSAEGDCCLAAQNIMLAANALGLGTCWIGFAQLFFNTAEMKKEMQIPEEYTIIAPLIVGYPANKNKMIEKQSPQILFWK